MKLDWTVMNINQPIRAQFEYTDRLNLAHPLCHLMCYYMMVHVLTFPKIYSII